jgi:hypothetical protein
VRIAIIRDGLVENVIVAADLDTVQTPEWKAALGDAIVGDVDDLPQAAPGCGYRYSDGTFSPPEQAPADPAPGDDTTT